MTAKTTITDIGTAVIERYLTLGTSSSLADIAKYLDTSLSGVRKLVSENNAFVPGCDAFLERRPSYSKDYPGMVSGAHGGWVYAPKLGSMRNIRATLSSDLGVYDDPAIGGDSKGLVKAEISAEIHRAHEQKR